MSILERILDANTTLIGFDSENEINVNKIVSFIPNIIAFTQTDEEVYTGGVINATEILEYFNSLAHSRDYKLSSLLNNQDIQYVVVDISNLTFDDGYNNTKFIAELQSKLYNLSNDESLVKFKLILLSSLYLAPPQPMITPQLTFRGGQSSTYLSDLVIQLSGGKIKIIKDRRNVDNITIDIREELRDLSLKQLFNENTLKT
jgi:hypothetical protein